MNTETFKRSEQLEPLNGEHQEGLLFISRVRQYLDKISVERLRNYVLWYWKNHIRTHFFQEERILTQYMLVDHPLIRRMREEHSEIRELILSLDRNAERSTLITFCNLIEAHIQFEEEILYCYLELHLSEQQLNKIKMMVDTHPVESGKWEDVFWLCE
jgi:hemerythrin-like domain-containing protein